MPGIKVNGVELAYEEYGSGKETIVFTHGWQTATKRSRELGTLLPAGYHAYVLDLRGYGQSRHVMVNLTFAQWADDIYRFSLELGFGKFIYVSPSMGGGIGMRLALDHPEVLKALVAMVTAPHARFGPPQNYQGIREARRERQRERSGSPVQEEFYLEPNLVLEETIKANVEIAPHLSEIKVPTLMILGGKDEVTPPELALRSALMIPGAKVVFYQDKTHMLIADNQQRIIDEIKLFIDQLNKAQVKN